MYALELNSTLIFCETVKFCVLPDGEDGQVKHRLMSGEEQLWVRGGKWSDEEEVMSPCANSCT